MRENDCWYWERFADAGIEGSDAGTSKSNATEIGSTAVFDKAADMIENLRIKNENSSTLLGATEMAQELQDKLGG